MCTKIPGLMASVLIALLAFGVSLWVPGPGSIFFAILIGLVIGNVLPPQDALAPGLGFAENTVLPLAIALMGSELQMNVLSQLGFSAFLIVIPPMVFAILCSLLLGRMLRLSVPAALMLGIGNSVCGSSAVLATAPAVTAKKHDTAVAVAAVNLMGTIGMFLLPGLAVLLTLPETRTAYLLGGSLQAVGQVAAAGFSVSDAVGDSALVIKMLRVLMIGPIVLILHLIFHSKSAGAESGMRRRIVPPYILGFIACAVLACLMPNSTHVIPGIRTVAKLLMVVAMAAVGFRIRIAVLLKQGPKALAVVAILSFIQVSTILLLIRLFA